MLTVAVTAVTLAAFPIAAAGLRGPVTRIPSFPSSAIIPAALSPHALRRSRTILTGVVDVRRKSRRGRMLQLFHSLVLFLQTNRRLFLPALPLPIGQDRDLRLKALDLPSVS